MSAPEKIFQTIFKKHSFLGLSGVLESLQTLLEEHNIIASDGKKEEINEADLVIAAKEALEEKAEILENHKKQVDLITQLQKELALITSFAMMNSSKESAHLWSQAASIINSHSATPQLNISKRSAHLLQTKKAQVLNFITNNPTKIHAPDKIESILSSNAKEIKNIKSSYDKYHNPKKDNLTAEVELLTLPSKSVTKTSSKKKGVYKDL